MSGQPTGFKIQDLNLFFVSCFVYLKLHSSEGLIQTAEQTTDRHIQQKRKPPIKMKEIITSAVLVLFAQLAVPTAADSLSAALIPERCMLACPPGQHLHPKGCWCVDDEPRPVCPLIRCPYFFIPCDKFKVDKNGCPTCECQCSSFLSHCPTDCEHGTEKATNSNGCQYCRCKKIPSLCPEIKCEKACLYGTVTGADGCPTCQCKPFICPPICEMACLYGFERDEHGCAKCQCKTKPPPVKCGPVCAIYCPFGNVLDSRGCPTCRCKSGTIKERKDFY